MQFKNKKRIHYDIDLTGTYTLGDSQELSALLEGLGDTLSEIFDFVGLMSQEEREVAVQGITRLTEVLRAGELSLTPDRIMLTPVVLALTPEEPSGGATEEDADVTESSSTQPDWDGIELHHSTPYLHNSEEGFEAELVRSLSNILKTAMESQERPRAIRQVHVTEAHLLLMNAMGISFVDPRNDLNGFNRLVNDVHALRILSRPSSHFLQEPIRGYRTAEGGDRVAFAVKVPNELDPGKATDYFAFIAEKGRMNALRDLREIGLTDAKEVEGLAATLAAKYPSEVAELRKLSDRAAGTLDALPS